MASTSSRSTVRTLAVAALALAAGAPAAAQGTGTPGQGIFLPFSPNQTWYVCQGYLATTSGTHNNSFALDLTRDPNGLGTSACFGDQDYSQGEPVYAPGSGVVSHVGTTVEDLICLDLDVGGSLLIGHLDPATRVGEGRIDALEFLGLLAGPSTGDGGVDNGDYSHIHIQAYGGDNCTGTAQPFEGVYKFFGAPPMPDLRPHSALGDLYVNHYFGTGLSNLIINPATDDAGTHPVGCTEATSYNEIYLGNCAGGGKIHSGVLFHHLPVNRGEWVSVASLVVQTDGPYSAVTHVDIRAERNSSPQTFGPGAMPSARLGNLTSAWTRWSISDPWQLARTRETPNLRAMVQEVVNRPDWNRGTSRVALVISGASSVQTHHRRFLATERDPMNLDPAYYPARLIATQFRTRFPGGTFKGNNRPVASAGPDRFYSATGQKITLLGSGSFDPDGNTISYSWTQTGGPQVTLNGATTATPWFVVAFGFGETYDFELRVTDNGTGQLRSTDTVRVLTSACDPMFC